MDLPLTVIVPAVLAAIPLGVWFALDARRGLVLLAATAPVSNVAVAGPVKVVYVTASLVFLAFVVSLVGRHRLRIGTPAAVIALLMLLLVIYARLLGDETGTSQFLGVVGSILLVVVVLDQIQTRRQAEAWLGAFALSYLVAIGVMAFLLVRFPGVADEVFLKSRGEEGVRVQGTASPNTFAAVLLLVVSVFGYLTANRRSLLRYLALGATAGVFLTILLTQSRAALVGLAGSGILVVSLLAISGRLGLRTAVLGITALVLAGATFLFFPSEIGGYRLYRFSPGAQVSIYEVGDIGHRARLYWGPLKALGREPEGLGLGLRQREAIGDLSGVYKFPHNYVVKALVTYGILGGLFFFAVSVIPIIVASRVILRRRLGLQHLTPYMLAGLAAFFLHSQFHSNTHNVYLWVFWALTLVAARLEGRPGGSPQADEEGSLRSPA